MEDLTGRRFGKLVVIGFSHKTNVNNHRRYYWNCQCDCGGTITTRADGLKSGHTVSCGCVAKQRLAEGRTANGSDLIGRVFGDLTVIERAGSNSQGNYMWKCVCSLCGKEKSFSGGYLTHNSVKPKSCGCNRPRNQVKTTHFRPGLKKAYPKECRTLTHMKTRCYNANSPWYKDYGGRGIKVCDKWMGKFGLIDFILDAGIAPEGTSIDRVDNDGNYEPGNIRWATPRQQSNNKRSTVLVTYNGETMSVSEWAEQVGLDSETLRYRINNWNDVGRALTIPLRKPKNRRM